MTPAALLFEQDDGIVVEGVGPEHVDIMQIDHVPFVLRDRLGEPATVGLLDLFDRFRSEWTSSVTAAVGDRFERRLVEEISTLRVEMTQGFAAVRQELADGLGTVRGEWDPFRQDLGTVQRDVGTLQRDVGALRQDVGTLQRDVGALRQDVGTLQRDVAALRQDSAALRQELSTVQRDVGALGQDVGTLQRDVGTLRQDVAALRQDSAALRQDMTAGFASIRHEMADQRFEILKWAFLFWVGQFFAVAGLVAVVIRYFRV